MSTNQAESQIVLKENALTKIIIDFVSQEEQRYDTLGDWQFLNNDDGTVTIYIKASRQNDERSTAAIAVHECVEALACYFNGVTQLEVDEYDRHEIAPFGYPTLESPYFDEHNAAIVAEASFCGAVQLSFEEHEFMLENEVAIQLRERARKLGG